MSRKMRIGVIGAGARGAALMSIWLRENMGELVAVSDLKSESIDKFRGWLAAFSPEFEAYTSNDKMLSRDDLDIVFVTTFDKYHAEIATRVLRAGHNVFVEKPVTSTEEDARRLVDEWRKSGKMFVAGHEMRHIGMIKFAKDRIQSGAIGRPLLIQTTEMCGRMGTYFRRPLYRRKESVGSLTIQKGVHLLDIQSMLFQSRPARVAAMGGLSFFGGEKPNDLTCPNCGESDACAYAASKAKFNGIPLRPSFLGMAPQEHCVFAKEIDVNDNTMAVIEYESGQRGSYVECFFSPQYKYEFRITGEEGQMEIDYLSGHFGKVRIAKTNSMTFEETIFPEGGSHMGGDDGLARAVHEALAENKPASPDCLDGYYAVAVAEAIEKSCGTGRVEEIRKI